MSGWLQKPFVFPDALHLQMDGNDLVFLFLSTGESEFPPYLQGMLSWFIAIGFPQYASEVYHTKQILTAKGLIPFLHEP